MKLYKGCNVETIENLNVLVTRESIPVDPASEKSLLVETAQF
jgi:hypothetical protein